MLKPFTPALHHSPQCRSQQLIIQEGVHEATRGAGPSQWASTPEAAGVKPRFSYSSKYDLGPSPPVPRLCVCNAIIPESTGFFTLLGQFSANIALHGIVLHQVCDALVTASLLKQLL